MEEQKLRETLGNNIRRFRLQNNMSQSAVAGKLDISTNFLSDIERAKAWFSPRTLVNLAAALNVEPYELFKGDAPLSDRGKDILQRYAAENLEAVLGVLNRIRES